MKAIFKFFPAALALVALASCSNDDTLGSSEKLAAQKTMNVSVEELQIEDGAATRAAYYATATAKNAFRFLEGDKINVYDNNLAAYDEFTLGSDSKWATTTSNVTEHKFGVYPATRWENHGWTPGGLRASVLIPRAWNAAGSKIANSYTTNKETVTVGTTDYEGYTSNVPVWGATTDDATNVLNMDMKYLTAMLKISLSQVSDASAKWVKITSDVDHPISGYFYAILAAGTTPELTKVTDNEALQDYYTKGNEIIVALPGGTAAYDYCVYVPIISGVEYPSLKVQYGTASGADPSTVGTWTTLYEYTNKTFNRGTIYSSGLSARFYASEELWPEGVNAFAQVADQSNLDIVVNATKLNVKKDANLVGNHTIDLPATSKNVTLEFTNVVEKGSSSTLTIQGANFTGDFTLKLANESAVDMNINLPKASKVTLVGTYASSKKVTVKEAKKLVFGDGSTTTAATGGANLVLTKITEGIEVAHAATVSGTLDITGADVQVPVTIGGSVANLTTVKDVNVNTIAESIAISGKLLFKGNAKVTLKQGLINEIETAEAVDAILVNPEGQGIAAIKTYTDNTSGTLTTQGVSKWDGQYITKSGYGQKDITKIWTASQFASWANDQAAQTAPAAYTTAYSVTASDGDLQGDIDMANLDRTGAKLNNNFAGNGHTIKNIGNNNATTGLFLTTATSGITINNFTLDGVKIVKNVNGKVGAVFSRQGYSGVILDGITVKNLELGGTDAAGKYGFVKIGGLIGEVASSTIIKDCKVAGSIKGYQMLGGFVGCFDDLSSGVRTLAFNGACESDVTFTFGKTYTTAKDAAYYVKSNVQNANIVQDPYTTSYPATLIGAGTIGTFVGAVNNSDAKVTISLESVAKKALDKKALGFNNNWFEEETATKGVYIQEFFNGVTDLIGYSPAFNSITYWENRLSKTFDGTVPAQVKAFNAYSQTAN